MAKSAASNLVPLIILFLVVIVGAAIAFVVYQVANEVADKTAKKMEKHNVSFGSDGMKVGVKSRSAEEVGDSTQNTLMKMWSNTYFPAYKSKLGWGQSKDTATGGSATKRQPYSRTTSQQAAK